ncbi:hypothetical protein Syun_012658 [Stephania yunnanensis]|uniref:Uncharacterized protein n=1 Tax=Stephania yunnanensis TaxID=152371 RepID=A0AAP0PFJ9_9MAGN
MNFFFLIGALNLNNLVHHQLQHPIQGQSSDNCFSKIASQLTKSRPPLSNSGEKFQITAVKDNQSNVERCEADGSAHSRKKLPRRRANTGIKHSSPDEMLSQLSCAARDPTKGGSSLNTVVDFFNDYRNLSNHKRTVTIL